MKINRGRKSRDTLPLSYLNTTSHDTPLATNAQHPDMQRYPLCIHVHKQYTGVCNTPQVNRRDTGRGNVKQAMEATGFLNCIMFFLKKS